MTSFWRLGLLGGPLVGSSPSPAMHMAALAASGLKGAYTPLEIPPSGLAGSLAALFELGFNGLNVTVPHKRMVMPHLIGLSDEAAAIGAVNTLVRGPDGFSGHNTDALGFAAAYLGGVKPGARTLILGAGGAARAVASALTARNISAIIASRDKEAATELAAAFVHEAVAWSEIPGLDPLDLAVNATSASSPAELGPTIPHLPLASGSIMIDLNYGRDFNHFQELAAQAGAAFHDGLGMLAHQARGSFKIWTGIDPGPEPFLESLSQATAKIISITIPVESCDESKLKSSKESPIRAKSEAQEAPTGFKREAQEDGQPSEAAPGETDSSGKVPW